MSIVERDMVWGIGCHLLTEVDSVPNSVSTAAQKHFPLAFKITFSKMMMMLHAQFPNNTSSYSYQNGRVAALVKSSKQIEYCCTNSAL